jgi:hypothetical protein
MRDQPQLRKSTGLSARNSPNLASGLRSVQRPLSQRIRVGETNRLSDSASPGGLKARLAKALALRHCSSVIFVQGGT